MALFGKKRTKGKKNKSNKFDSSLMLLSDKAPWSAQEAYKALRTNITFSLPGTDCKIVCVSSGFQGDGKSINTINTAISFGQLGKKTLLIDCDMRLPTCATKLGAKGAPGLSDVLVGQSPLTEALQRDVHGIDFISAGNIPPDPTWLIQSQQMGVMLEELRKFYDWIFIDLPPVTTVADASIISRYADGFLLVVRHESTEYRAIADMLSQLEMAGAKILGFIYNDLSQNEGRYYYKNYYYKRSSDA